MAGDWIKVEHVMPDKPEVSLLADALEVSHDEVVGKLVRFWIWVDQQSIDGRNLHVTEALIDRVTFCPGFCEKMLQVRWLKRRKRSGFIVPNFDRHNGKSAKRRVLKTQWKRDKRSSSKDDNLETKERPEKDSSLSLLSKGSEVPEGGVGGGKLDPLIKPLQEAGVLLPIPNSLPREERDQVQNRALAFVDEHGPEKAEELMRSILDEKPKTLNQALFFIERSQDADRGQSGIPRSATGVATYDGSRSS